MSVQDSFEALLQDEVLNAPCVQSQVLPPPSYTFAIAPVRQFRRSSTFSGRCEPAKEADAAQVTDELDALIAELRIGRYNGKKYLKTFGTFLIHFVCFIYF